jgi:hypothetical protein
MYIYSMYSLDLAVVFAYYWCKIGFNTTLIKRNIYAVRISKQSLEPGHCQSLSKSSDGHTMIESTLDAEFLHFPSTYGSPSGVDN